MIFCRFLSCSTELWSMQRISLWRQKSLLHDWWIHCPGLVEIVLFRASLAFLIPSHLFSRRTTVESPSSNRFLQKTQMVSSITFHLKVRKIYQLTKELNFKENEENYFWFQSHILAVNTSLFWFFLTCKYNDHFKGLVFTVVLYQIKILLGAIRPFTYSRIGVLWWFYVSIIYI